MLDKDVDPTAQPFTLDSDVRLPWESIDPNDPAYSAKAAAAIIKKSPARRKSKASAGKSAKKASSTVSKAELALETGGAGSTGPSQVSEDRANAPVFRTLPQSAHDVTEPPAPPVSFEDELATLTFLSDELADDNADFAADIAAEESADIAVELTAIEPVLPDEIHGEIPDPATIPSDDLSQVSSFSEPPSEVSSLHYGSLGDGPLDFQTEDTGETPVPRVIPKTQPAEDETLTAAGSVSRIQDNSADPSADEATAEFTVALDAFLAGSVDSSADSTASLSSDSVDVERSLTVSDVWDEPEATVAAPIELAAPPPVRNSFLPPVAENASLTDGHESAVYQHEMAETRVADPIAGLVEAHGSTPEVSRSTPLASEAAKRDDENRGVQEAALEERSLVADESAASVLSTAAPQTPAPEAIDETDIVGAAMARIAASLGNAPKPTVSPVPVDLRISDFAAPGIDAVDDAALFVAAPPNETSSAIDPFTDVPSYSSLIDAAEIDCTGGSASAATSSVVTTSREAFTSTVPVDVYDDAITTPFDANHGEPDAVTFGGSTHAATVLTSIDAKIIPPVDFIATNTREIDPTTVGETPILVEIPQCRQKSPSTAQTAARARAVSPPELDVDEDQAPTSVSVGGGWTIPLLCLGLGLLASCMVIPQAETNRRLYYEQQALKTNLDSVKRQVQVNAGFLKTVMADPELAERLAGRQMKSIRKGQKVLPIAQIIDAGEMSPFSLVAVTPPTSAPAYRAARGTIADLCNDSRSRLFLMGVAMLMTAGGLVLGAEKSEKRADRFDSTIDHDNFTQVG